MRNISRFLSLSVLAGAACVSAPGQQPDAATTEVVADARSPTPEADAAAAPRDTAAPVADAAAPRDSADPTAQPFTGRVTSGTRLKPVYAKTAEGQLFFMLFWLDVEQKTTCAFATAEDGKQRCLPLPLPRSGLRFYADAQCGQPLFPADAACADLFGVKISNGKTAVYRFGPSTVPAMVYSLQTTSGGTTCVPDVGAAGQRFFSVGAPVTPETFVEADVPQVQALPNRRIVPAVRTAADGMKERAVWYDTMLHQSCQIIVASDGQRRCQPYPSNVLPSPSTLFADAACTQGIVESDSQPDAQPRYFMTTDDKVCPTRSTFFGKVLQTPGMVYRKSGTACTGEPPAAGRRYYALGPAVPATAFVAFTETREGTGRLQQRVLSDGEGAVDPISIPFDTQTNELCDFDFAEDGKVRCMPRVRTFLPTFADSACQKPAGAEVVTLNCGARNGQASLAQGPWCGPVVRTFRLGMAAPAPYRKNPAGTCAALNGVGYAELGELIPPSMFVEAQLVRD